MHCFRELLGMEQALHSPAAPTVARILSSNVGQRGPRTNAKCGNWIIVSSLDGAWLPIWHQANHQALVALISRLDPQEVQWNWNQNGSKNQNTKLMVSEMYLTMFSNVLQPHCVNALSHGGAWMHLYGTLICVTIASNSRTCCSFQEEIHCPTHGFRHLSLDLFIIGWRGYASIMGVTKLPS